MIKQSIQSDLVSAMKAKDTEKTQTLRYILAQIKNKEIDKQDELSDEEVINTLRKESKKLQESIDSFTANGRSELGKESEAQLALITTYLPKQMTPEDIDKKVTELIDTHAELFKQNPHALIGICVKELKSVADSAIVAQAVQKHI